MQTLCVVDTCSLIYLSELRIANKTLHDWLFTEFPVGYSDTVWEEIKRHSGKMGKDAKKLIKTGRKYVHRISEQQERIVFAGSLIEFAGMVDTTGTCRLCNQPILRREQFVIDLSADDDRGERHNCCLAVQSVSVGNYQNIIFLTDDFRAIKRYVRPIFDSIPLGTIWSSHDFIVYLYLRHKTRIRQSEVEDILRDLTANITDQPSTTLAQRLRLALKKTKDFQSISQLLQGL